MENADLDQTAKKQRKTSDRGRNCARSSRRPWGSRRAVSHQGNDPRTQEENTPVRTGPRAYGLIAVIFPTCNRIPQTLAPCVRAFMINNSNESQLSRTSDSRIPALSPVESVAAMRLRCPNCDLPAIAPVVSTYLRSCVVENNWVCNACGFEWSSSFNGLVV